MFPKYDLCVGAQTAPPECTDAYLDKENYNFTETTQYFNERFRFGEACLI